LVSYREVVMMGSAVSTPFPWFGGKANHSRWILPYMPPHQIYCEVFGGSAAMLFAKNPSAVEVYNDLDSGLVNFFRVLRDPDTFPAFLERVTLIPYAREEFEGARASWHLVEDPIERAALWFYVARASFSGHFGGSWSVSTKTADGMMAQVHKWIRAIDGLPEFHHRIRRVAIEHRDAREFATTLQPLYDGPDTLWYVDPPYVPDTRSAGKYAHELTADDHARLLEHLMAVQGMVMVSGYDHPMYARLTAAGWKRIDHDTPLYAQNHRKAAEQRRRECLWLNPAAWQRAGQVTIFDVLGGSHDERK